MRRHPIVALALILAAVFFLPAPADAAGRSPSAAVEGSRVDAVFRAWDRRDSPGCALAVVREGRVVRARGYGMASLEHGIPITPGTVFDIGSAAKQFAAASVVLLSQEGKLSLDDPIRRYVPELPEQAAPVTLRHMLNHTSGLRDYTELLSLAGARTADVTTNREALAALARQKGVDFPAGSRYRYSNSGYFLLSLVVQRVSGKTLRDFARERLFAPLEMASTQYVNDHRQIVPRRATGYAPAKDGGFGVAMSDWEQNGDGGLQTTVLDLARWNRNFDRPAVGGEALISELTRPGTAGGRPIDYALGLRIDTDRGLRRVRHGGSWVGFKAEFLRYPDRKLFIAVLCNCRSAQPSRLARDVAKVYLPELAVPEESPAARGSPASAADLGPFSGLYWNASLLEARRIGVEGGRVLYGTPPEEGRPLLVRAPGRFAVDDSTVEIRLDGADGRSDARVSEESPGDPREVWTRVPRAAASQDPAGWAGTYASDELAADYRIEAAGGRLTLHRRGADPSPLTPLFGDVFLDPEIGALAFERVGSEGASFRIAVGLSQVVFKRKGSVERAQTPPSDRGSETARSTESGIARGARWGLRFRTLNAQR